MALGPSRRKFRTRGALPAPVQRLGNTAVRHAVERARLRPPSRPRVGGSVSRGSRTSVIAPPACSVPGRHGRADAQVAPRREDDTFVTREEEGWGNRKGARRSRSGDRRGRCPVDQVAWRASPFRVRTDPETGSVSNSLSHQMAASSILHFVKGVLTQRCSSGGFDHDVNAERHRARSRLHPFGRSVRTRDNYWRVGRLVEPEPATCAGERRHMASRSLCWWSGPSTF